MVRANAGGKNIPLYMGMKAVTAITRKYGSLMALREVLSDTENEDAQNEATFFVAHQLNINASIIEESEPSFKSAEVMEASCRPHEYAPLFVAVCDAIKESTETSIDAEIVGADSKNVTATQDI